MLPIKIHNFLIKFSEVVLNNEISWYSKLDKFRMVISYKEVTIKIQYHLDKKKGIDLFYLDIMDKNSNTGSFVVNRDSCENYNMLKVLYNHIQAIDLDLDVWTE